MQPVNLFLILLILMFTFGIASVVTMGFDKEKASTALMIVFLTFMLVIVIWAIIFLATTQIIIA